MPRILRYIKVVFPILPLCACSSLQPHNAYSPHTMWQKTSCERPLIIQHKVEGGILAQHKLQRLKAIGLQVYDGSATGEDIAGNIVTYTDSVIPEKTCQSKEIEVHVLENFESFESFKSAKRKLVPIYVRHMTSAEIKRDSAIKCSGVFNYQKKLEESGTYTFQPTNNEELCWEDMTAPDTEP